MKLTIEKAKQIIAKVHKDLKIDCDDRFPIKVNYFEKDDRYKVDYWAGRYDYSKSIHGIEPSIGHAGDVVIVDDEKRIAISVSFFPEPSPINLDENGKYVWSKE